MGLGGSWYAIYLLPLTPKVSLTLKDYSLVSE